MANGELSGYGGKVVMAVKTADASDGAKDTNCDKEKMFDHLDSIGAKLAKTRSMAIEGRQNTGIEEEWLEDEEYYEGIDDANRNESKAWRGKPLGASPAYDDDEDDDQQGSTIFLNITRPYCDAVAARIGDMVMSNDDPMFNIKPTPKAELLDLAKGKVPRNIQREIEDSADSPEQAAEMTQGVVSDAEQLVVTARESARKVQTQISDWHAESQFHTHNRRLIEDAAKVGTGVLKGPIPAKTTKMVFKGGKLEMVEEIKPVSRRILYRNFYPDPAAGEDIHNGSFTWERDDITRASLQRLIGLPGYIDEQVKRVMAEGPMEAQKEFRHDSEYPGLRVTSDVHKTLYEIWYYYGTMRRRDLMTVEYLSDQIEEDDYKDKDLDDFVHVHAVMINNRVIKATVSHLSTGDFPYDLMVWQRRMGLPWGMGVARQVRPAQRIVVGAMRHMMDNAGIAGGPMLYVDTNVVQAADGETEVKPWKVYIAADDYEPGHNGVREAIQFIEAPMRQGELQAIIELGLKMAEDVTGLPLVMQGQTGPNTPETLGGMVMQNNNASTVLRRVIKLYDDLVTEPHIRRYYNHILQYADDDDMKGEFNIIALGSSSLVERDMASNAMIQLGNHILNPIFKKDPVKWLNEVLRMNKLEPSKFEYEDEQWQQIVEGLASQGQTPPDSKVEVEQMRQQGAQQMAQFKAETDAQMLQLKAQLEAGIKGPEMQLRAAEIQAKVQSDDKDREVKIGIAQLTAELDLQLAQLKEAGDDRRKLDDVKQKLQDTVMKLQTQVQLSGTQAATPAVEPRGRAPDGQSFQR
jgi:hypothetical protein